MTDRYMTASAIERNLAAGIAVEQWLGIERHGERRTIKWMRIIKDRTGRFCVCTYEVYDDGDEHFIDIYEFSSTDPESDGNPVTFDGVEDALTFATTELRADPGRFVGGGRIQQEYAEYLKSRNA